jgi:hypothetical protein
MGSREDGEIIKSAYDDLAKVHRYSDHLDDEQRDELGEVLARLSRLHLQLTHGKPSSGPS